MKSSLKPIRRRALLAQQRRALRALLDAGGAAEGASGGVPTLDPDTTRVLTDDTDRRGRSSAFYTNPRTKRGRPGALETAGPSETASDGQDHPPIRTKVSRLFASRKRLVWRPVTEGAPPQDANVGPTSVPPPRSSNVYGLDGRVLDPSDAENATWAGENDPRLIKDNQHRIVGNLANVALILTHDPVWKDAFWFDEFTDSIAVRKEVPIKVKGRWHDGHEAGVTIWLQRKPYSLISLTKETVRDALKCIVSDKRFHSFATELDGLVWDCVPRIDTWLSEYAGAMDTAFTRMVGPKFLLSLVARQYDPGCKVDTVLVFEGQQGNKKSSVCRALAGPGRFHDHAVNLESRDTATVLRGKAIVEFQEIGRFTKNPKTNEIFKVFIRMREDEHVHKWEHHARVSKRSWVGMATSNPDAYLSDETGTRTVWPVPLDTRVSVGPIDRDRDQLLAEAVQRYKWYCHLKAQLPPGGDVDELPTEVRWWLVDTEEELAKEEQSKRFEVGVWDSHIRRMMANTNSLSVDEILRSIDPKIEKWSMVHKREVVKVLLHVGWIRRNLGTAGRREWRYWRPGVWRNLESSPIGRHSAMEILLDGSPEANALTVPIPRNTPEEQE